MDPAPAPLDQRGSSERHISPDSSSTRPNPFDDADASSRKRRRTSASASLSPITPTDVAGGKATGDAENIDDHELDIDFEHPLTTSSPETDPTTPEHQTRHADSCTTDPPSSQVTINLRRQSNEASTESAASSRDSTIQKQNITEEKDAANVDSADSDDQLVDNAEKSAGDDGHGSPQSSPTSETNLQPVVRNENDDDDDDMIITSVKEKCATAPSFTDLVDIADQFPFRDAGDDLLDTLHRVIRYISGEEVIEDAIPQQLSNWIRLCATYMESSDPRNMASSLKSHERFWVILPEIVVALRSRLSTIAGSQTLSYIVLDLLSTFSRLTAQIVSVDSYTLSTQRDDQGNWNTAPFTLFCTDYLSQLHGLLQTSDILVQSNTCTGEETSAIWNGSTMAFALLDPLETTPGDLIGWIAMLTSDLNAFAVETKSHIVTVAALSQVTADCLRESSKRLHHSGISPSVQLQIEDSLRRGQSLWQELSAAFVSLIEKHISLLNTETTFAFLQGLTAMLESCGPAGKSLLDNHLQRHANTPTEYLAEAAAWEFRLEIFAKLIQSSQMQLRVKAVNALCSNLIHTWKRLSDATDDDASAFLCYLGCRLDEVLVDYVIGPKCHPEIIIESANIIGFLIVTKTFTQHHTDRLWAAILASQDPRVGDALTRMFMIVCNLLQYDTLLQLCEKFQQLSIEDFSASLRSLWETIIKELIARCHANQLSLTNRPFLCCLRILRESTRAISPTGGKVIHADLHQSTIQRLRELLCHGIEQPTRQELYENCISDLRAKSEHTLGSLWFLSQCIRPAISTEIQHLIQEYDFATLVVEELHHAVELSTADRPAVSGPANHPRRDLIHTIIQTQPSAISSDLNTKLWDLLVGSLSRNADDRSSAWQIMATVGRGSDYQNLFLQTCFAELLPKLPAECFSEGMLEIVKDKVFQLVNDPSASVLDDEKLVTASAIEQLWRVLLIANDDSIVTSAIRMLASNVYLESRAIATFPAQKVQQIHINLANRCLKLMEKAAQTVKHLNGGSPSGDDESMVFVASEEDIEAQERIFIRALRLLRYFLEASRMKPQFSMPDVRSLIPQSTSEIKGDPALLQYQSFDGTEQTDIKPLEIGKQNSAGSLLARLRQETGFENYRAFYRGQQFLPNGTDICKSLEELHIHDGLILVKRATSQVTLPPRVRPGLSPLELKILSHFRDLWEYLTLEDKLATEVYHFLLKVPVDGGTMDVFDDASMNYEAIFGPDQPYKTLYTIHALVEYTAAARIGNLVEDHGQMPSEKTDSNYGNALRRSIQLLVLSLEDEALLKNTPMYLKMQISCTSMMTFARLLHNAQQFWGSVRQSNIRGPSPDRLVSILEDALDCTTEEALEWVASTLATILQLSISDQDYWSGITKTEAFASLLARICAFDNRSRIRSIGVGLIEEIATRECHADTDNEKIVATRTAHMSKFLWSLSLDILPKAMHLGSQCQELLRLMQTLTTRLSHIGQTPVSLERFAVRLAELLLDHTVMEDISQPMPCDVVAYGLVALLDLCVQIDMTLAAALPRAHMESLLETKLFPQDIASQGMPKVILNVETRQKLYGLIFRHIRHDSASLQSTLEFLNKLTPFYANDHEEPYRYDLPFQFDAARAIRAPCGYVGLRNLSNTCYLNSLLTQLYMNTEFRQFLLSFDVEEPDGPQKLLFSSQNLFGYLQDSIQRFVDTTALVKTIKTYDDTVVDIHSQMDVDEFYNLLFDRWEGQLPSGSPRKKLRSFYGGQLVQQVKSKECDHISERLEPFSAIQCDIKGKATLQDSLQAYVDGEIMEGDNKYKCSSCDSHVDAVKRACLKDIPDNMIFHLKRFDFNLRTLQRSKINDHFAFPETIDLRPYTIDFLSGTSGDSGDQDVFELVGVLVHSGTAESGHYYSYIRERPSQDNAKRWIEFNDELVSPWDPAMLEESTFGGTDHSQGYANGVAYDKVYSAYMLFYQRASSLKTQQEVINASIPRGPLRAEVDGALQRHIQDENILLLRRHCLFDPSHTKFVQACIGAATIAREEPAVETDIEDDNSRVSHSLAMDVAVAHLDQIVSRAKDVPLLAEFSALIQEKITCCEDCALSFFMYLSDRPSVFRTLVQRNPDKSVRREICKLFLAALDTIATKLPDIYYPDKVRSSLSDTSDGSDDVMEARGDLSILQGAVSLLDYLWENFQVHIKSWDEYFSLLLDVAKRGRVEVAHLLAADYLGKCLQIVSADVVMDMPSNYVRMLQNIYRRYATQPASYRAVLALIDYLMGQLESDLSDGNIVEAAEDRLNCDEGEFPWTSMEVNLVHYHPERQMTSIFIDKLLTIDQASPTAHSILERLVRTGRQMDVRIFNTLRWAIQGDTTTEPLDPYIRAALRFVDCTDSLDQAQRLTSHICAQAASLQNSEGATFLDFMQEMLDTQREEEDENKTLQYYATTTMPEWAPYLLVYPDGRVRRDTMRLLEQALFQPVMPADDDNDERGMDKAKALGEIALKLGTVCLMYLQDAHIRRRAQIERDTVTEMIQMIEKCSYRVESSITLDEESKSEFKENRMDVMAALRRFIVDEVEDEASDWEGSAFSSDAMDEAVDAGTAADMEGTQYAELMQGLPG